MDEAYSKVDSTLFAPCCYVECFMICSDVCAFVVMLAICKFLKSSVTTNIFVGVFMGSVQHRGECGGSHNLKYEFLLYDNNFGSSRNVLISRKSYFCISIISQLFNPPLTKHFRANWH